MHTSIIVSPFCHRMSDIARIGPVRTTLLLFPGAEGEKISWACSAGWCRFPDTYGRDCRKLTLPRNIADTATIWELAGFRGVVAWNSRKRNSPLRLYRVQNCTHLNSMFHA